MNPWSILKNKTLQITLIQKFFLKLKAVIMEHKRISCKIDGLKFQKEPNRSDRNRTLLTGRFVKSNTTQLGGHKLETERSLKEKVLKAKEYVEVKLYRNGYNRQWARWAPWGGENRETEAEKLDGNNRKRQRRGEIRSQKTTFQFCIKFKRWIRSNCFYLGDQHLDLHLPVSLESRLQSFSWTEPSFVYWLRQMDSFQTEPIWAKNTFVILLFAFYSDQSRTDLNTDEAWRNRERIMDVNKREKEVRDLKKCQH